MTRLTTWRKRRTLDHDEGTTRRAASRYARNLAATLATATITGLTMTRFYPHPWAVAVAIDAVIVILVAPFIVPIDREDTD